jgi:hypothetical protein
LFHNCSRKIQLQFVNILVVVFVLYFINAIGFCLVCKIFFVLGSSSGVYGLGREDLRFEDDNPSRFDPGASDMKFPRSRMPYSQSSDQEKW